MNYKGAHDPDFLLESFARLALKLDRLPTSSDLRLARASDPEFPNDKTFYRLGSKTDQVSALAEFCQGRPEYREVLALCSAYQPPQSRGEVLKMAREEVAIGFVYLIPSGPYYKIGRTNAAGRRERELAIQLPQKTRTIHVIKTDDPPGIEAYWHKRFAAKRRNGGWFELDAGDVIAFKRRRFM